MRDYREHRIEDRAERGVPRIFVFFQAEDGIRDYKVTGVQTCALPIFLQLFLFGSSTEQEKAKVDLAIFQQRASADEDIQSLDRNHATDPEDSSRISAYADTPPRFQPIARSKAFEVDTARYDCHFIGGDS